MRLVRAWSIARHIARSLANRERPKLTVPIVRRFQIAKTGRSNIIFLILQINVIKGFVMAQCDRYGQAKFAKKNKQQA